MLFFLHFTNISFSKISHSLKILSPAQNYRVLGLRSIDLMLLSPQAFAQPPCLCYQCLEKTTMEWHPMPWHLMKIFNTQMECTLSISTIKFSFRFISVMLMVSTEPVGQTEWRQWCSWRWLVNLPSWHPGIFLMCPMSYSLRSRKTVSNELLKHDLK